MTLQTKMNFTTPRIKNVLTTINGMPHQLVTAGLQTRDIYPELKKCFYKEHRNMIWKEFLTKKFGLWVDMQDSINFSEFYCENLC